MKFRSVSVISVHSFGAQFRCELGFGQVSVSFGDIGAPCFGVIELDELMFVPSWIEKRRKLFLFLTIIRNHSKS